MVAQRKWWWMPKRSRVPGIKKGGRAQCKTHGDAHMLSMGRGRRICAICNPAMDVFFLNRADRRTVLH